jgi:hypothetical protein
VIHTPPSRAITGEPIIISVSISDPLSVNYVLIEYLGVGDDSSSYRALYHLQDILYRGEIPPQRLPGIVSYAILVRFWDGSILRIPVEGFYAVEVVWGLPRVIVLPMATISGALVATVVGVYFLARRMALAESDRSHRE